MNKNLQNTFKEDLLISLQKIGVQKSKNVFITSDLEQIAFLRIKKEEKLKIILNSIKKIIGKNYTIFSPSASFNIINTKDIFDINNTPSFEMGPLAEYIRTQKNSLRSLHPLWSVSGIGKNKNILKNISRHAYGIESPWSRMLKLNSYQINLGIHPSKAATLVHHIETIFGVPYRFNKQFYCKIKNKNKIANEDFYLSVFYKNQNIKKRIKLNEHFFDEMKKYNKIKHIKTKFNLDIWFFSMNDFYNIAIKYFLKNIFNYLEFKPNLDFQKKL